MRSRNKETCIITPAKLKFWFKKEKQNQKKKGPLKFRCRYNYFGPLKFRCRYNYFMHEVCLMELHSHFVLRTCVVLTLLFASLLLGYLLNKARVCVPKVLRTITLQSSCLVDLVLLPWGRWYCFFSWTPWTSTLLHLSSHSVPINII